jgi:hypothetical protein
MYNKSNVPCGFYVYAYIRQHSSKTAKAGTPYYIGKGTGSRAWGKHTFPIPNNYTVIVVLESNLTEIGAFALERRMIRWHGRKDTGTGILTNKTDGGDGVSGYTHTAAAKRKISEKMLGISKSKDAILKSVSARKLNNKPNKNIGKSRSDELKLRMSIIMSGRTQSAAHKAALSKVRKGKPQSAELIAKRSAAMKGKAQQLVTCPHCNKTGGLSGMKRYHFNNCKHNNDNTQI